MALGLNRRRINVKGGGVLQIREIDPTPTTNFSAIGFLKGDVFEDSYTMVESVDSKGDFIDTKAGARHVMLTSQLMQTAKDEIDLMRLAEGKYHEAYYKVVNNDGSIQEFDIPICRIEPGVTLEMKSATERLIELKIHALAPATALTRTPTDFNTAQWQPYVLNEEATTAAGPPSDAATVPQAGI